MTFDEWMNEVEVYSTRKERLIEGLVNYRDDHEYVIKWLEAAYMVGFRTANVGAPTPPYEKPMPSPFPRPFIPDPFSFNPSCSKCGLKLDGVMGYVCNDQRCPTFVHTWSGTITDTITSVDTGPYFGGSSNLKGDK